MKGKLFLAGMLALALTFGLVLVGCDTDDGTNTGGPSGSVLSAPSSVYASAASSSSISVSWSSVSGASGYFVYRSSSSSGTYSQIGTSTSTSYTNNGLSANTTYYYKVSAYNSYGESAKSTDYDYATTSSGNSGQSGSAPSAPSSVYASAVSSSSISVSWNSVSGASGYFVYRSSSSSGTYSLIGTSISTSYTDTGLSASTTYYYKVSAYNDYEESAKSTDYDYATTSSGSIAGSSPSNAITISSSGTSGSFPSGLDAVWYTFTKNGSGILCASDRYYNSVYTADIVIDVYNSNENLVYAANGTPLSGIDVGNGVNGNHLQDYIQFTNWSGKYYVKVRPYGDSNSNKGSFAIFAP